MIAKLAEKDQAVGLRKQGWSYSEILKVVPVAKSSLSIWLHEFGLSKKQKQRLTLKKLESAKRGGLKSRLQRLKKTNEINKLARIDVGSVSKRELWLMGTMLYWAEGAKSKSYMPSVGMIFSNSDPKMIKLFIKWCKDCLLLETDRLNLSIYIHETKRGNENEIKQFWAGITGISIDKFDKIYYKRHSTVPHRHNIGEDYRGLCRVMVRQSTNLNRKVAAWTDEVCHQCGVV